MDEEELNELRTQLWGPELLTVAGMAFYGPREWEAVMRTEAFQRALKAHVERVVGLGISPRVKDQLWAQFARSRVTMEIIRWEADAGTAINIKVFMEDPEMAPQDSGDAN